MLKKKSQLRSTVMANLRKQSPNQITVERRYDGGGSKKIRSEKLEQSESKVVNDEDTGINTTVYRSPDFSFDRTSVVN